MAKMDAHGASGRATGNNNVASGRISPVPKADPPRATGTGTPIIPAPRLTSSGLVSQRMFCPFHLMLWRAIVNAHLFHTTAWIKSRLTCSITAVPPSAEFRAPLWLLAWILKTQKGLAYLSPSTR